MVGAFKRRRIRKKLGQDFESSASTSSAIPPSNTKDRYNKNFYSSIVFLLKFTKIIKK